ncbi:MAG TPA: hypothetical protein VFY63_01055 [Pseudorhizobium sp.]|nr:hypothetical protein [Pseudorhizobium sp.]
MYHLDLAGLLLLRDTQIAVYLAQRRFARAAHMIPVDALRDSDVASYAMYGPLQADPGHDPSHQIWFD